MNKRGDIFKNPYAIVIIILLLFIILIILTVLISPSQEKQQVIINNNPVEEGCSFCDDLNTINSLSVAGNLEGCNSLSSNEAIELCKLTVITRKAKSEDNIMLCNQLTNNEDINSCKNDYSVYKSYHTQG
ncbi:MAG: hypothetical protein V1663_03545 [archaeon]